MALRNQLIRLLKTTSRLDLQPARKYTKRCKATVASELLRSQTGAAAPGIISALPAHHLTTKVVFDGNVTADFKYIWLRDNCRCRSCLDASTRQKLVDTPALDVGIRPRSLSINDKNQLEIVWNEKGDHTSLFDSEWLFKYGRSFMHNTFESDSVDAEHVIQRPDMVLWNKEQIWSDFPETTYAEFMESEEGVSKWLNMFYKYGVALLRGVPVEKRKMVDVVKRFAYVKETQYGEVFDVINSPKMGAHLAYSGLYLAHHTDMNYREKSPGMQLLHCLKAENPGTNPGGESFFVDGFRIARWLEDNEPTAFHILACTPVRFSIKNEGMRYSTTWPVICTDSEGDVTEIHYNNRTMQPLQAPCHVVSPFYHAYKLFSERVREPSVGLEFNMVPGDLVAFNNRRVLHGRGAYDVSKVNRHLQGCYVDIDEALSRLDYLQAKYQA